jgi:hypothetical protein
MNFAKPVGPVDLDKAADSEIEGNIRDLVRRDGTSFRQGQSQGQGSGDGEMTAHSLSALLGRVLGTSAREIDNLVGELQTLREKLQTDGQRIQRDIAEYATLSQSVMQLTKIISESVRKLPDSQSAR